MSACRRGCCWTPFGHSTAAEGCTCHVSEVDLDGVADRVAVVLERFEGAGS